MPYIEQSRRDVVTPSTTEPIRTPGELNFALISLMLAYVRQNWNGYATINDVMGAVAGANAEFYRRIAVPYEEGKIEENGDLAHFFPEDSLTAHRTDPTPPQEQHPDDPDPRAEGAPLPIRKTPPKDL